MKIVFPLLIILALSACDNDSDRVAVGPKLKSTITFLQNQSGEFRPAEKVEYFYSKAGILIREEQSQYDVVDKTYFHFSTTTYTHNEGQLLKKEQLIHGSPKKITTTFEYAEERVIRIKEDNDVDTEAAVNYLSEDEVEIVYTHSNGRWFTYRFTLVNDNKESEKTFGETQQLASKVTHRYDDGNNPYTLLGYTDLFFSNVSSNNRIKTSSEYFADAFPQSIPVSYVYTYNDLKYPTEQITTYQALGHPEITNLLKITYDYW